MLTSEGEGTRGSETTPPSNCPFVKNERTLGLIDSHTSVKLSPGDSELGLRGMTVQVATPQHSVLLVRLEAC